MEIENLNTEQLEEEILNTRRKMIKLKTEITQDEVNILREEKYLNELLNRYFQLKGQEKRKK